MATTNLGLTTIMQSDPVSPDPINSNFEKVDALGRCYVTAAGSSGIWRYRRWSDGTYECWGTYHEQTITLEEDTKTMKFSANYPITFSSKPCLFVSTRQAGNSSAHTAYVENATATAEWWCDSLVNNADVDCMLYAIGRVS